MGLPQSLRISAVLWKIEELINVFFFFFYFLNKKNKYAALNVHGDSEARVL